jgi:hypothetical protein
MDPLIKAFKFWAIRSLPRGRTPNTNDAQAFYVQTRLEKPKYLQGLRWDDVHRRLMAERLLAEPRA